MPGPRKAFGWKPLGIVVESELFCRLDAIAYTHITAPKHWKQTYIQKINNVNTVHRLFLTYCDWLFTAASSYSVIVSLDYGIHLHFQENDRYARICSILGNVSIQSFFPFEHIKWLSEHNILSANSSFFGTGATVCWALSLLFSILRYHI